MQNIQYEQKGDKLILTIDVSPDSIEEAKASKSGKTRMVASTHGFTNIGGVKVSLNVTVPNE